MSIPVDQKIFHFQISVNNAGVVKEICCKNTCEIIFIDCNSLSPPFTT